MLLTHQEAPNGTCDENVSPNIGDGSGAPALLLVSALSREEDKRGEDAFPTQVNLSLSSGSRYDEANTRSGCTSTAEPGIAALPAHWEGVTLRAPHSLAPYTVSYS